MRVFPHHMLAPAAAAAMLSLMPLDAPSAQQQDPMQRPTQSEPSASGQTQQAPSRALESSSQAQQQTDQLAAQGDKLIGKKIVSSNDESIGEIKNVVMGPDRKVSAVLVDVGGIMGIGGKTVALPLEQLRPDGDKITSNLTKEQAEAIPEYKEQDKPRQGG